MSSLKFVKTTRFPKIFTERWQRSFMGEEQIAEELDLGIPFWTYLRMCYFKQFWFNPEAEVKWTHWCLQPYWWVQDVWKEKRWDEGRATEAYIIWVCIPASGTQCWAESSGRDSHRHKGVCYHLILCLIVKQNRETERTEIDSPHWQSLLLTNKKRA